MLRVRRALCDDGDGLLHDSRLLDDDRLDRRFRSEAAALAAVSTGGNARRKEHNQPDDEPRDGATIGVAASILIGSTTRGRAAYITPAIRLFAERATVTVIRVIVPVACVEGAVVRFARVTDRTSSGDKLIDKGIITA